jgi:uncharacterized membrane protein YiaA
MLSMTNEEQSATNRKKPATGGVDITPLYRAAAKAQMIQGIGCIVAGVIVAALGVPYLAFVLVPVGVFRLLYGAAQWYKYID